MLSTPQETLELAYKYANIPWKFSLNLGRFQFILFLHPFQTIKIDRNHFYGISKE